MQIQPLFMTVGGLLTGRLFSIPQYQRAYSWETKQRQDLFEDLLKVGSAGSDASHFMATVVALRRKKLEIAADQFVELEIVDGQQRITTIVLLLKAVAKALDRSRPAESKVAAEIEATLVKGDDVSLLLLQTNHDSSHAFANYLRHGTVPDLSTVETVADRNLCLAMSECEEFVARWDARRKDAKVELVSLIRHRLSLIFHEIDDESLVYTVFEVLNSRGLDVTWFDKLKSLLMAHVYEHGDRGGKAKTISEMHKLWTEVYRTIGLRQNLNRETVRFAGTLVAKDRPNRPLSEEDAVAELVGRCGTSVKKVLDTTGWVLKVARAEDRALSDHRLNAPTRIVQARLAVVAILLRGLSAKDEQRVLRRWETVTFRIFGMMGQDARKKVGDYVRLAWQIHNERLDAASIIKWLDDIGEDCPIDEAIKGLERQDCYNDWKEELRYFFFRYEEFLARERGQVLSESQWNKIWLEDPAKSIEHICPQSSGSQNPKSSGVFVHRLGNLMMLPPSMNSKLQDDPPVKKVRAYKSAGLFDAVDVAESIKRRGWDRAAVDTRERKLIKWAKSEWDS